MLRVAVGINYFKNTQRFKIDLTVTAYFERATGNFDPFMSAPGYEAKEKREFHLAETFLSSCNISSN